MNQIETFRSQAPLEPQPIGIPSARETVANSLTVVVVEDLITSH